MPLSPTPNMGLQKPEPGVTTGPQWATLLNAIVDALDAHDHSSGKGVKVTSAGFDVTDDIDFDNTSGITGLHRSAFASLGATLSAANLLALYCYSGDLFWNDETGTAVQLTDNARAVAHVLAASAICDLNGYRLVDIADAAAITDAAKVAQVQGGVYRSAGTATGSSGAYVAAITLAPSVLTDLMDVFFYPNHSNSGAATLNLNSFGAKAIVRPGGAALTANDLTTGVPAHIVFDLTNDRWTLLNPVNIY